MNHACKLPSVQCTYISWENKNVWYSTGHWMVRLKLFPVINKVYKNKTQTHRVKQKVDNTNTHDRIFNSFDMHDCNQYNITRLQCKMLVKAVLPDVIKRVRRPTTEKESELMYNTSAIAHQCFGCFIHLPLLLYYTTSKKMNYVNVKSITN